MRNCDIFATSNPVQTSILNLAPCNWCNNRVKQNHKASQAHNTLSTHVDLYTSAGQTCEIHLMLGTLVKNVNIPFDITQNTAN